MMDFDKVKLMVPYRFTYQEALRRRSNLQINHDRIWTSSGSGGCFTRQDCFLILEKPYYRPDADGRLTFKVMVMTKPVIGQVILTGDEEKYIRLIEVGDGSKQIW